MFCLLGSDTEQHFDVAAQMIDAVCGDLCSARCLGEDEGALNDGPCVQRESSAAPAPFRVESIGRSSIQLSVALGRRFIEERDDG
jgi:hypothetical protein